LQHCRRFPSFSVDPPSLDHAGVLCFVGCQQCQASQSNQTQVSISFVPRKQQRRQVKVLTVVSCCDHSWFNLKALGQQAAVKLFFVVSSGSPAIQAEQVPGEVAGLDHFSAFTWQN
jgi:hypothetical protein